MTFSWFPPLLRTPPLRPWPSLGPWFLGAFLRLSTDRPPRTLRGPLPEIWVGRAAHSPQFSATAALPQDHRPPPRAGLGPPSPPRPPAQPSPPPSGSPLPPPASAVLAVAPAWCRRFPRHRHPSAPPYLGSPRGGGSQSDVWQRKIQHRGLFCTKTRRCFMCHQPVLGRCIFAHGCAHCSRVNHSSSDDHGLWLSPISSCLHLHHERASWPQRTRSATAGGQRMC